MEAIDPESWNNIPVCVVRAFKMLISHCEDQDKRSADYINELTSKEKRA